MKSASIIPLVLLMATLFSASCKRSYQCTCPTVTMPAQLYTFEVKASSLRTANSKCVSKGKEDPVVYKPEAGQCQVLTR